MKTTKMQLIAVVLLSGIAQWAFAAKTEPPLRAANKIEFETVTRQIRAEMQPDGRFGKLNQHERESVDGGLKDMSALFDKTPEVAGMNDADKRKMFNTQEAVNATLLRNDGDRLICKKEIRSGTHFQSTTCRTAREIERDRNGAQDWARKTLQLPNDWDGT